MFIHTITIAFLTRKNGKRVKKAIDEIAVNSFVQVEGLTDDFGVEYDQADYNVDSDKAYSLKSEFGSVIHTGTKAECDLILKGLTTYGIREDKFVVEEAA